ncbi:MAG: hypothetical protein ABSA75_11245 [Candidatus Bathyarchaeia archaeon]
MRMIAFAEHFATQSPHPWQMFGSTTADSSASIRKMALTGHAVAAEHLIQRRQSWGLMKALCISPTLNDWVMLS